MNNQLTTYGNEDTFLQRLVDSGQLPSYIKKPETAFTIIQYGKELGLSPMTALNYIISVQGKLTLSVKGKQAILLKNKVTYKTLEDFVYVYEDGSTSEVKIQKFNDSKEVKIIDIRTSISMTRNGNTEVYKYYFSEAQKAGLVTKDVWVKYPKAMMYARCFSALCDRMCSDLTLGFYSTEDWIDSMNVTEDTGLTINSEGEVTILENQ